MFRKLTVNIFLNCCYLRFHFFLVVVIESKVVLLCRFIYCDDCSLSGDNVLPVLYVSKKYLLPALTQLCVKFLEDNLHVDNVCVVYEQCLHFDDDVQILDKCRTFIETRTKEVFSSDTFRDLSRMQWVFLVQLLPLKSNSLFHQHIWCSATSNWPNWRWRVCDTRLMPIAHLFSVRKNFTKLIFKLLMHNIIWGATNLCQIPKLCWRSQCRCYLTFVIYVTIHMHYLWLKPVTVAWQQGTWLA